MIPKIIHYCWFGGSEKNEKIRFCMESWKKYLPDYEIREWSEKDLHYFAHNRYVKQAYTSKKWAFVADVFRLFALYKEGGIYLDTDVEVRKSLSPFLNEDFFIGSEKHGRFESIGTAVIGAAPQNQIIKNMLEVYDDLDFIRPNRIPDLTPNTVRLVPVLQKFGVKNVYSNGGIIEINPTSHIYPDGYFCVDTPDSFCVHHFQASWLNEYDCKRNVRIPLGKNFWIGYYRYKKIKPDAEFKQYPETLVKKLFECNLGSRKKILLTLEKEL